MKRASVLAVSVAAFVLLAPANAPGAAATPASAGLASAMDADGGAMIMDQVAYRGGRAVAVRGPRGGAAVSRGAVAVGPRGGAAVRRSAVVGPRGNVAVGRSAVVRPGWGGGRWVRPAGYWWRPGGAIVAGAAIGFVAAATAAAWAGPPPGPSMCWYYTDPSRTQGFWDACP